MAEHRFKALRDLVAGTARAESRTFTADPEAVRIALSRGWVDKAKAPAKQGKQGTRAKKS